MEEQIDVRGIRERLGLTQTQLAERVGVDQSTVSNWEKGSPPKGPARKLLQQMSPAPKPRKASREERVS